MHSGNVSRNQRESEKPGRISGTVSAEGSLARTQRSIASINGLSSGEALPIVRSVNSISSRSAASPSTCAIRRRGQLERGLGGGDPLQHRPELEQRVVAGLG